MAINSTDRGKRRRADTGDEPIALRKRLEGEEG